MEWREARGSDLDNLVLLEQKMELVDSWRRHQFDEQLSTKNMLVAYNKWHGQLGGYLCYNHTEESLVSDRLRARETAYSITLIDAIERLSSIRNKQSCVMVTRDDNKDLGLHLMLVRKNFKGKLAFYHDSIKLVFSKALEQDPEIVN
jgi:hypothetical protein